MVKIIQSQGSLKWKVMVVLALLVLIVLVVISRRQLPLPPLESPSDGGPASVPRATAPVVNESSGGSSFTLGKGDYEFTLTYGGRQRSYKAHVPSSYRKNQMTPVILNFHGGGANADNAINSSLMNVKSNQAGFIAIYPQGTGPTVAGKLVGTWNAGRCCGYAKEQQVDDVGFTSALLDDLATKFNINAKAIYATGLSNGALMSYRLACELSNRIAAVAPIAAQDAFDDCRPSRPVSVIHFHGTADPAAPYQGGHCGGRTANDPGWECSSVVNYLAEWRGIDGCTDAPAITYQNGDAVCSTSRQCRQGTAVTLCTINGGGHTWPGGAYYPDTAWWRQTVGSLTQDISANDQMWSFFQAYSLP